MPDSSLTGPFRNAARAASSPVRNYINQHFEQVKSEIRNQQPTDETGSEAWDRVADLEQVIAEMSVHQAQSLARLTDRVAEMERLVERMADVVAAMTVETE